jgi:hypothetical protein
VRVTDAWAGEQAGKIWEQNFGANARIESIESDEIAILDASGKLVVYSLEEVRPVVDTKVKAETALTDLQVFRTLDRYVVLAARQLQFREGMANRYAVQSSRNQPVIEGQVYAFERGTGKPLWGPVDLPATATLLNQPAHVPLLIFAMNVHEQSRASAQRAITSVLCLDTRDGRIVDDLKLNSTSTTLVAIADPEHHKLELHRNGSTVSLVFGDKKPEPDPPADGLPDVPKSDPKDDEGKGGEKSEEKAARAPAAPLNNPFDNPFGPAR